METGGLTMSEENPIVPESEDETDIETPDSVETVDESKQSLEDENKGARRTVTRRKRNKLKSKTIVVDELPSMSFVMGGEHAKWLIPACFVAMILISVYGGMVLSLIHI